MSNKMLSMLEINFQKSFFFPEKNVNLKDTIYLINLLKFHHKKKTFSYMCYGSFKILVLFRKLETRNSGFKEEEELDQ